MLRGAGWALTRKWSLAPLWPAAGASSKQETSVTTQDTKVSLTPKVATVYTNPGPQGWPCGVLAPPAA